AFRHLGQRCRHATFDAADRLFATTGAGGARQRVFRDTAGRAVRIEYWSPGDHRAQQVVSRRYEGERLMEETVQDQDGTRRTHSAYDARGAMVSETLTIEPAGELALSMRRSVSLRIAYAYGAGGELLERQITDATGHTLRVEQALDSQGQLARLESR